MFSEMGFARPRLWSRAAERRVTWLELFFDLIFVAAIAQVGSAFTADYTFAGLGRYTFTFVLIWSAWNGHTFFMTRFDSDDLLQRVLTFVQVFAVAAMAANAREGLTSRSSAGFGVAYAAMRLVLALQYMRARHIPEARRLATTHAASVGFASAIWIVAAISPLPTRFWLWGVALSLDLLAPLLAHHTEHLPPHPAHLPERFGLFTLILLGESVTAVMRGMESQETWNPAAVFCAVGSMAFVFLVWWWYFELSGATRDRHTHSRAEARRYFAWNASHLPLYLSIAIGGIGLQHVIAAAGLRRLVKPEITIALGAAAVLTLALSAITNASTAIGRSRVAAVTAIAAAFAALALLRIETAATLIAFLIGGCGLQAAIIYSRPRASLALANST